MNMNSGTFFFLKQEIRFENRDFEEFFKGEIFKK